jgi:hypothetical protein
MKTLSLIAVVAALALSFSACGKKDESGEGGDKKSGKKHGADDAWTKPALEEKDLSSTGEAFKGWFAKGPKDAKVMGDLGGVRIATPKVMGPGAFDLAWALKKADLKELKEGITKGSEIAKSKVTFTVDTPEALEWTSEAGTSKSMHFSMSFQVSGQDVSCYSMPMGFRSAEELAFMKETCKSLVKK